MDLKGEIYQFLFRSNVPDALLGSWNTSPAQRSDISINIHYQICDKPFEINFAHIVASRPSVGASEYIDPYVDKYMSKRWPKCIKGIATITSSAFDLQETHTLKNILLYLRKFLWTRKDKPEHPEFTKDNIDQIATTYGYRREYFNQQLFDISGNRRPSNIKNFVATEIGEYIGPGVSCLTNVDPIKNINELVWSWIIPFKDRKNIENDLPNLEEKITAIRKHFNSYDELEDARRHLSSGEIKACIRSAASSIDAILRFYCKAWGTRFPMGNIQFDDKIETILDNVGKPSYESVDRENLEKLLYLYRARNSMHEGDCYFKNNSGNLIFITEPSQAENLVRAAEEFTLWIDSLV